MTGQTLPPFRLPCSDGFDVDSQAYRQERGLVLALLHADCEGCEALLALLDRLREAIRGHGAEPLALVPALPDALRGMRQRAGAHTRVLSDPGGAVARRIAGGGLPAVVIADRYGEVFAELRTGHQLDARQLVAWLEQIEAQCPECGASEW